MAIVSAALTKGGAAVALVGVGATGIYLTSSYFGNSISKYDKVLIDFLKDDPDNDIIFEIKKGENGTEDLTESDIAFSGSSPSPITAKVKVTVDTSKTDTNFKNRH